MNTTELTQREKFESWWERAYHNGNPPRFGWENWRDGDGYKIDDDESELDGMWNAWQAASTDLVEALESTQRAIGYIREQSAEWERKAISNFEDCSEMAVRIEELESQRKMAFMACNRWADKCRDAEKRIAELEARTVTVQLPAHKYRECVNGLLEEAIAYAGAQQLRERLSSRLANFVQPDHPHTRCAAGFKCEVKGE